ncbi:MAG: hypothetical protein FWC71_10575 [Defluviitaleaceae bacterium]|nr:hypothetical protein [Defluviitaleaceae bacterium]
MSKEWYLQAYNNGDPQFIPHAQIHAVLSKYPIRIEEAYVVVTIPEGNVDFYMDCPNEISDIMIAKPLVSPNLNQIIYEIMQCGRFIFFAPDAKFPIVLDSEVMDHLPIDMLDALGKPKLADNPIMFSRLLQEMYL